MYKTIEKTQCLFIELSDPEQEICAGGEALPFQSHSHSSFSQFQLGTTNNSVSSVQGTRTGSTTNVNNVFNSGSSSNNFPYISY